jgi:hypothetical protein
MKHGAPQAPTIASTSPWVMPPNLTTSLASHTLLTFGETRTRLLLCECVVEEEDTDTRSCDELPYIAEPKWCVAAPELAPLAPLDAKPAEICTPAVSSIIKRTTGPFRIFRHNMHSTRLA